MVWLEQPSLDRELVPSLRGKRIGILGYGHLGKCLHATLESGQLDAEIRVFTRQNLTQLGSFEFDFFFNCAGTTGDYRSKIVETIEANTGLATFLIRNLRVRESCTILSSSRVYGFYSDSSRVVDERDAAPDARDPEAFIYEGSKVLVEAMYQCLRAKLPYRVPIVRLTNVYGRFEPSQLNGATFLKLMLQHARERTPMVVRQHPDSAKDYVFVDDAITGILRAAVFSRETGCFNIGSGRGRTAREWIDWLGIEATYENASSTAEYCHVSIEKAQRVLGFRPQVEFCPRELLVRTA